MDRFFGLLGIILIFGIAYLMSNNRKAINYKTVADNKRHLKFRMFTQRVEFPRVEISHKISVMLQYPVYQELIQP